MKALSDCIQSRQKKGIVLDEKTILFAVSRCIEEQYGRIGAQQIQPIAYKNGSIRIRTHQSVWAGELWQQREMLIQCCNQEFSPQSPIKKVIIQAE